MGANCVLLFSGGRDSTLAALRLNAQGHPLVLVTITSGHLVGAERVRRRLAELRPHLPRDTRWLRVQQPINPAGLASGFSDRTCLPCQHAYVLTGYHFAKRLSMQDLALGYVAYQGTWPEQTADAATRLRKLLGEREMRLHLPVYDITSKLSAISELEKYGVSHESLEQKCLKQVTNITLPPEILTGQLDLWEDSIRRGLDLIQTSKLIVLEEKRLGDV